MQFLTDYLFTLYDHFHTLQYILSHSLNIYTYCRGSTTIKECAAKGRDHAALSLRKQHFNLLSHGGELLYIT